MSESGYELPFVDIPPECIGCPQLKLAATLHQETTTEVEATINARAAEESERDSQGLAEFFDEASSRGREIAEARYQEALDDIDNVTKIIELMPDSAHMSVGKFLEIYRTDENQLGDTSIGKVLGLLTELEPDNKELIERLTVANAIAIAAQSAEAPKEEAATRIMLSQETADAAIYANDTEQQYRDVYAGQVDAHYVETVGELLAHCPSGVDERKGWIRRNHIAKYCGSSFLKGKS